MNKLEILEDLYDRGYLHGVQDALRELSEVFGEEAIQMTDVWKEAHQ